MTAGRETARAQPEGSAPQAQVGSAAPDAELTAALASVLGDTANADLRRLYAGRDSPLWLDGAALSPDGRDAAALLQGSADEGLEPADYEVPRLDTLVTTPNPSASVLATLDTTLSTGLLRYFHDVHVGRVDPRTLGFALRLPPDSHDFVAIVQSALAGHRLAAAAAELRPGIGQYDALRGMLGTYRALAAGEPIEPLPDVKKSVHPGEPYEAVITLSKRLVALGDLPKPAAPDAASGLYEGAVVEGVSRFQRRHGLDADGVLGQQTVRALNVPFAWRARQIALALERLRWLPDLGDAPLVAINIPMFHLWAWDDGPARHAPAIDMGVIVGRAVRTETPVIDELLRSVIFRPYWNVPRSILRNEVLPAIERNPAYLEREDMEIVEGAGDNAEPVGLTGVSLAQLRDGTLRVRQRPGPKNALGLVKFVFPNAADVYMHDTPAQALFARSRRDFSHGCVRLERPVALAEWVLRSMPEWTPDRITEAMHGSRTFEVRLPQPIRVLLFYTTAAVMSADGTVHFAEDIYGRDRVLDEALVKPRT
jgi:murein L,D-transpeptidase YcbB/YkuD